MVFFIIAFAAMIFTIIFSIKSFWMPSGKLKKNLKGLAFIIEIILVVFAVFDITNLNDNGIYQGTYFFCGLVCVIEILIMQLRERFDDRGDDCKILKFASKAVAVAAVLELTLFNFHSYHLLLGDYNEKKLLLSNAEISNGNYEYNPADDSLTINGKDEVLITFENLGEKVGTLNAELEFAEDTPSANIILDITDETHESYRYDIAKTKAVNGYEHSSMIPCQFSGELGTLRVKFTMDKDNGSVVLKSLTINSGISFDISYIRFGGIAILSVLAYSIVKGRRMNQPYYQNKPFCNAFAAVFTAIALITAIKIVGTGSHLESFSDWRDELKQTGGNQISKEIVDAFEAGQVSLLDEVDPALLEVENPYDWGLRNESGAEAKWDHVMYNGKYYSYYGIAPVILLFLPYHMITGYYFPTNIAVLIFGLIGIVFLTMTYMQFIKKHFWRLESNIVLSGLMIIQLACGIWYSIGRTLFYEISISSGFAFVTMGAYFLISSGITARSGRISKPRTALSSLFLAVAVLCRPTLAVYCIAACLFYIFAFGKAGKSKLSFGLCAFVPMVVLGAAQMYYNYVRFDSVFDFGIQYSLTINDFVHSQYHTNFVLIGIYNYLFALPGFKPEFPFIGTEFTKLDVNGYYFSDVGNTSGILFLALPVFAYFLSKKAYRISGNRKNAFLTAFTCVLMPFVIICSIWESGYAVRYTADFSWQIIIGAYVIAFLLYQKCSSESVKKLFVKFMVFSVFWSFAVNAFQIFNFSFSSENYPELWYAASNVFEFWR